MLLNLCMIPLVFHCKILTCCVHFKQSPVFCWHEKSCCSLKLPSLLTLFVSATVRNKYIIKVITSHWSLKYEFNLIRYIMCFGIWNAIIRRVSTSDSHLGAVIRTKKESNWVHTHYLTHWFADQHDAVNRKRKYAPVWYLYKQSCNPPNDILNVFHAVIKVNGYIRYWVPGARFPPLGKDFFSSLLRPQRLSGPPVS